jgi:hypothetical protein
VCLKDHPLHKKVLDCDDDEVEIDRTRVSTGLTYNPSPLIAVFVGVVGLGILAVGFLFNALFG